MEDYDDGYSFLDDDYTYEDYDDGCSINDYIQEDNIKEDNFRNTDALDQSVVDFGNFNGCTYSRYHLMKEKKDLTNSDRQVLYTIFNSHNMTMSDVVTIKNLISINNNRCRSGYILTPAVMLKGLRTDRLRYCNYALYIQDFDQVIGDNLPRPPIQQFKINLKRK